MKAKIISLSIRTKVIITVVLVTFIFSSIIFLISHTVIINSFLKLENQSLTLNLDRVQHTIDSQYKTLNDKTADWSAWDDTYNFVKNKNQQYIDANLGDDSMYTLQIGFMMFLNTKGEVIFTKARDINVQGGFIPTTEIESYIKNHINDFLIKDIDKTVKSIIPVHGEMALKYGSMMVVAKPIIKNDRSGPIAGTLIFGKFLDQNYQNNLSSQSELNISLIDYNASSSKEISLVRQNIYENNKYFINIESNDSIAGYFLLYNLNNNPVYILKAVNSRPIYKTGLDTFNFFTILMMIIMIIIGIISFSFADIEMVGPILKLDSDVTNIANSGDISKRIDIKSRDEISNLILSINNLLDQISISQEREKVALEKEKNSSKKFKDQAEEDSRLNKLMVGRELKMIELKEELQRLKEKCGENS